MATANDYAQWIVNNSDKKGTPDFETVVKAYEEALAEESASVNNTQITESGPQPIENVDVYALQSAIPTAIGGPEYVASQALRNTQAGLINAGISPGPMPNMTQTMRPGAVPSAAAEMAKRMYSLKDLSLSGALKDIGARGLTQSATDLARFVTEPLGGRVTIGQALTGVPKVLAAGAMAPENLLTLPYNMAAYEQEKIRQNPRAPGLEYNPYAQVQRGEAATQGRAAAANQMRAVANMPFGNVTPQERAMLEEDMRMRQAVRRKAFEKVMGPVAPGSF